MRIFFLIFKKCFKGFSFVESDKLSAGFSNVSIVKVTDTNVVFLRELRPKLLRIIPFTYADRKQHVY